ncbi:MAG: Iron-sulfur cluster assembly accessory [Trebouxia sp. A1-2]|nr:MAG: Iron-sulfur cluster assembly accessory [Trebouxia sp. A1-2]
MSYLMDFEQEANVKPEDSIIDYEGQFRLLDYSDALIGGGFQFHNPNAQDTCGCGKSFGV